MKSIRSAFCCHRKMKAHTFELEFIYREIRIRIEFSTFICHLDIFDIDSNFIMELPLPVVCEMNMKEVVS